MNASYRYSCRYRLSAFVKIDSVVTELPFSGKYDNLTNDLLIFEGDRLSAELTVSSLTVIEI